MALEELTGHGTDLRKYRGTVKKTHKISLGINLIRQ